MEEEGEAIFKVVDSRGLAQRRMIDSLVRSVVVIEANVGVTLVSELGASLLSCPASAPPLNSLSFPTDMYVYKYWFSADERPWRRMSQ